jgi:hypothetical protein
MDSLAYKSIVVILAGGLLSEGLPTLPLCAQTHDSDHQHHMAELERRGGEAMGFDQRTTEHHFRLSKAGGAVEVSAKDPGDQKVIEEIRAHLKMQEKKFGAGDFGASEHTHGHVPPGVETMQRLRSDITYKYQPLKNGGRLTISSSTPEAVNAIHNFLKFQIDEHETGDSTQVR